MVDPFDESVAEGELGEIERDPADGSKERAEPLSATEPTASDSGGEQPGDEEELARREEPSETESVSVKEYEAVLAERDDYLDALRHLQADFDNFRKRAVRQQNELVERAGESLLERLLPTLDALGLALAHLDERGALPDSGQEDRGTGAEATLRQIGSLLRDTLAKEGLEVIDPLGEAFDPSEHEAVMHLPSEGSPSATSAGEADSAGADSVSADSAVETPQTEQPGSTTSASSGSASGETAATATATDSPAREEAETGEPELAVTVPTVAEVLRPGYRLKGRLLRPAMVSVRG